jgi:hypothetical protein
MEINVGKSKYMFISRHQNSKDEHYVKTANKHIANVAILKYLGTTAAFLISPGLLHPPLI